MKKATLHDLMRNSIVVLNHLALQSDQGTDESLRELNQGYIAGYVWRLTPSMSISSLYREHDLQGCFELV